MDVREVCVKNIFPFFLIFSILFIMMNLFGKHKTAVLLFTALVVLLSLQSCSRSKPTIEYGFISLVLYEGPTKLLERYSFFIIPEDEDGIENLDVLHLYNDREQLRWTIRSDEWVTYTADGSTWIGTRSIALQNDESLPRGLYRAVLVNKGGEKGERFFTFDGEVRFPFPSLEISAGRYNVSSAWPKNRLICYDNEGNYVTTVELGSLNGTITALNLHTSIRTVALWAEDPDRFCSAYTNIVSIR